MGLTSRRSLPFKRDIPSLTGKVYSSRGWNYNSQPSLCKYSSKTMILWTQWRRGVLNCPMKLLKSSDKVTLASTFHLLAHQWDMLKLAYAMPMKSALPLIFLCLWAFAWWRLAQKWCYSDDSWSIYSMQREGVSFIHLWGSQWHHNYLVWWNSVALANSHARGGVTSYSHIQLIPHSFIHSPLGEINGFDRALPFKSTELFEPYLKVSCVWTNFPKHNETDGTCQLN